jgi:glycosyltransferase involved in cell wall biosynthesis
MKILFVTPRYPFPLLSGDRVRAFHQLKTLSESHEVFLLCPPPPSVEADEALCHAVKHRIHLPKSPVKTAGRLAAGVFSRTPLQTLAHADRAYRREALSLIRRYDIDIAHVQLVRMAPVLQGVALPRFMDFVDALSVNMDQLAERSRGPKRIAAKVESRRLRHYEQLMVAEYDAGGITSVRDRRAIGDPENMFVIPQGAPSIGGCPEDCSRPKARIIFTGRMSYFPNDDAVCWFANDVFPIVRRKVPDAEFVIAGADPGPRVTGLAALPGVRVLGFVESISEELVASTVAIVPMRCGTGMQTKIVEAMASGTPVVITSEGLGSLEFKDGYHVSLADGKDCFAQAVIRLLTDKDAAREMAGNARREVDRNYSWPASTNELLNGYRYAQNAFANRVNLL